jgi:hypothetical protein
VAVTQVATILIDFAVIPAYTNHSMRRLFAITLIAALTGSMSLPVWATACAAMAKQQPMCHRMAGHQHHSHHCDMMVQEDSAPSDSSRVVKSRSEQCPMNCCMRISSSGGTAVTCPISLPSLDVSDKAVHFPAIAFHRSGFSSHTDRGPPAL